MAVEPRGVVEVSRKQAFQLLSEAEVGRIVYTVRALPAIFPARHQVEGDSLVVRTRVATQCAGSVVAYEADEIDTVDHQGWCVVVTGVARQLVDRAEIAHYDQVLQPLVRVASAELIRITPEIVTGYRMVNSSYD